MAKAATATEAEEDLAYEYEGEPLAGADAILQELDGSDSLSHAGYPLTRDANAVRQSADSKAMSATFCIVTRSKEPNYHNNQVQILDGPNGKGLILDNYQQNPVVLYDHGFGLSLPIGTCRRGDKLDLTLQKSKAVATCYFSQTLPDAAVIFGLIDENILRAASIQYVPTKAMRLSRKPENMPEGVEDCRWNGWDFVESLLMEWSVVAIGADPGAIRRSIERGTINGYRIGPALKQGLSQYAEKPKPTGVGITLPAKVLTIDVPPESQPLFDGGELRQFIRDAVAQGFADHLGSQMQAPAGAPVDTPNQNVTNVPQTAPAQTITGEQLAQAYREQSNRQDVTQELARQLPGLIRQEVEKATKPILEQQRTLNDRLKQCTGRA